jgi:hypothetical protein
MFLSARERRILVLEGPPMSRNLKETPRVHTSKDQDENKGATEQDGNRHDGNTGMQEQLGHRDQDPELKDADSGLPG